MNRIGNNQEVKKLNRNTVFRYMNELKQTNMADISAALSISGPTVLTIINDLKQSGLVREVGEYRSTGGRKAKAFATVKDAKYAIGVDITKHHVGITYTNLSRKTQSYERIRKVFCNTEEYFVELGELVRDYVKRHAIPEKRIEGMGISVPGIVDTHRNVISRSHVLNIKDVPFEECLKHMPYPCVIVNDANAAAIAECHDIEKKGGVVYLALSNSVGGAVVFDAELKQSVGDHLYMGDNWRSGEFGHIIIHPNGKTCYCGKKGCLDAYCSAYNLADTADGRLETFFEKLQEGSERHKDTWKEYMSNLAIAVENIRVCFDCDIILGGYVGGFMEPYLQEFVELLSSSDIFDSDRKYVRAGRYKKEASALGAAIYRIDRYIAEI